MFGLGRKDNWKESDARQREARTIAEQRVADFTAPIAAAGGATYDDYRGGNVHRVIGITVEPAELSIFILDGMGYETPNKQGEWTKRFTPSQCLAVSLDVDGSTVQTATSEKQNGLLRAGIGGVLFGGAGAVVGAATAKTATTGYTSASRSYGELRIGLDCPEKSVLVIDFKSQVQLARDWYVRLSGFMEKAKGTDPVASKLDRLNELGRLLSEGVVTEAEFSALKVEILGAG